MRGIILIAPPASGKGTQAELIKSQYNLVHISTGDLLREIISVENDYARKISQIINSGKLVSDDIVIDLIKKKLRTIDCENGYILDGFPRNINQALCYDKMLREINLPENIVIFLNVDKDIAEKRVLGRLICPKCKTTYNEYFEELRPESQGTCDNCHIELIKRSDDNIETFNKRYETYYSEIKPLLEYYKGKNNLFIVNSNSSKEITFEQIKKILEEYNDKY